jgi:hypothetical protein
MKITIRRILAALIITAMAAGSGFCQLSIPKSWYNGIDPTLATDRNVASQAMIKAYIAATASGFSVLPDAADTTMWPVFSGLSTGASTPKTHAGWTFNAATGMLTGTGFTGPVTGTASGNPSTATLAALATGILKNTTSTGALSIATPGVDYATPDAAYKTYTATATAKDVVYMTAAGTAARAKADSVNTVYAIGFATETKTAAACLIQTAGVITITGKTFTPGLPVYISPTTAGDCTQTPPATVGHQAQVIGIALTATDVEITLGPVVEVGTGVATPAEGGTGVANGTNNTLTYTGNYTLGLTLTGNTAVTLPTSGTLLYSGGALGTPASGTLTNCTFPTLNQNTSGTAANLSGTPALPDGTTATTQSVGDNTTKIATTAFVLANGGAGATVWSFGMASPN